MDYYGSQKTIIKTELSTARIKLIEMKRP